MPYIYKITNQINGKSYIGKTMKTIQERWSEHCADYKRERCEKRPLYAAMNKYGIENFKIEQIEECSDQDLSERECFWIEYYETFKNGYNATLGGDGKAYIDYDLVVANYQELQNCKKVAEKMGICTESVSKILKNRNISIKSGQTYSKETRSKPVLMYDKSTQKFIQAFPSRAEAARWLINEGLTNCKLTTIQTHIGEVCNGKRKSAAGFIWKTKE